MYTLCYEHAGRRLRVEAHQRRANETHAITVVNERSTRKRQTALKRESNEKMPRSRAHLAHARYDDDEDRVRTEYVRLADSLLNT